MRPAGFGCGGGIAGAQRRAKDLVPKAFKAANKARSDATQNQLKPGFWDKVGDALSTASAMCTWPIAKLATLFVPPGQMPWDGQATATVD